MAGNTRERILEVSLELFAQSGYLGTSMSDIAKQLGITKGALYKHYRSKQEILDRIVERMNEMDYARAAEYEMPETEPDGFAEAYLHTPVGKIRAYSEAQFDHWTKEPFAANFRRMLTLEQYREPKLAQLYQDYLAGGPLQYMAAIFRWRIRTRPPCSWHWSFTGRCSCSTASMTARRRSRPSRTCCGSTSTGLSHASRRKSLTAEKPLDKGK